MNNTPLSSEKLWVIHKRNGVTIGAVPYISIQIEQALNESRECSLVVDYQKVSCQIEVGDDIEIACSSCNFGTWSVLQASPTEDSDKHSTSFQLAPCSDILRCSAVSGSTVFDEQTNAVAFGQIPGYVLAENGVTVNLVFQNLSALNLGSRYNTQGRNILEILRSLCGATGNSFRVNCSNPTPTIEVGAFGQDTGLSVGPLSRPISQNLVDFGYITAEVETDASELLGCVYVEGGSFTQGDTAKIVLMGAVDDPPNYTSAVPGTFAVQLVTRLGKQYFRLCTNPTTNVCTRSIQLSNIVPVRPDIHADRVAAAQLLTDIAVKYLTLKSTPHITIRYRIAGIHCQFHNKVGDLVSATYCCGDDVVFDRQPMHLLSCSWSYEDDAGFTDVELSNWLYDPDDLLGTSNVNKDRAGNNIPYTGVGVITQVFNPTALNADPVCDIPNDGRQVTINYSATGYSATPSVSVSGLPGGWTYSILSATLLQAVICVTPPIPPFPLLGVAFTVTVSGSV